MNIPAIAKRFACDRIDDMRWAVNGNIAQCKGCSGHCGMSWLASDHTPEMFVETKPQLELFPA